LAAALRSLDPRLRAPDAPDGLAFPCDAAFLGQMQILNLTTRAGDVDISFRPSGTEGYEDLARGAVHYDLGGGLIVPVAALADIIRSKEAANRTKDREALPGLRSLLDMLPRGGLKGRGRDDDDGPSR
jgi:hypothetical protein